MFIYVLYRCWDTPDNEGNDIVAARWSHKAAMAEMKADAAAIKACYSQDFWEEDMTWEDDDEIHLGHDPKDGSLATIYCWRIDRVEVK